MVAPEIAAQPEPDNGPRQVDPRWHVLHNATLIPRPGETLERATIVLRDGLIVSVEQDGAVPAGARAWDCGGGHVYAGLIEPHLAVDAPRPDPSADRTHWNAQVMPQRSVLDGAGPSGDTRRDLRRLGFGAAAVAPKDGVFRGAGSVILLDDPQPEARTSQVAVVRERAYHTLAFDRSGSGYPRSLMGSVALIRQTLLDAQRHANNSAVYQRDPQRHEPPAASAALAALSPLGKQGFPLLFDVADELQAVTAIRVAAEFDCPHLVLGNGTEFRRLDALAKAGANLILPLSFPDPPRLMTLADAESVSLRQLMTWEQAPTNPARVLAAGLEPALTTHRLSKRRDFRTNLHAAIRHGLTADQALAMLTTHPARMLGVSDKLGQVAPGMIANLVVADGPLFDKGTKILDVWIRGRRYRIRDVSSHRLEGAWNLQADADNPLPSGWSGSLNIGAKSRVELVAGDVKVRARAVEIGSSSVDFIVDTAKLGRAGVFAATAVLEGDTLYGRGRDPDGGRFAWKAERVPPEEPEGEKDSDEEEPAPADFRRALPTPLGAFGLVQPPTPEFIVITNVTVWRGEGRSNLEDAAIAVRDGVIAYIGPSFTAPKPENGRHIDGRGGHVTAGMIDCHSHTGISGGVNEGTQAVTAEVRIGDALNPDDINWYRQLAGGVTAVQQLHGSANPIGGQSSIVKLRWGSRNPLDMQFRGAKPGIKFALGENVKRSRSDREVTRYPRTRMGVEALIRDRFAAATDYAREWQRYRGLSEAERATTMQPRRDLELDALVEVLGGIRWVHCHSYRQDEILMLGRLATSFGFKIGTYQHGLECYKVADAVKETSRGASIFSDWWAYKYEVIDAIPHNGAILNRVGVPVSFNSDSSELARRLNAEAAKAVKYGGTDEVTALSFVTSGPAFQMGVERRVGSLRESLEADFVLWSGHPLSTYTRCLATFIDGAEYFSVEKDRELRREASAERQRIVQKILTLKRMGKLAASGTTEESGPRSGEDEPGVCGCHREWMGVWR